MKKGKGKVPALRSALRREAWYSPGYTLPSAVQGEDGESNGESTDWNLLTIVNNGGGEAKGREG